MRVLIVDDEPPTLVRLRQLLAAHPDGEIAGEAANGTQAMELAAQLRPHGILLDIQMPGCSGIDVAACLPQPRPHIIFCTACDQYAVEAFELNAVDYLLKPVGRARLAQSLDRIRALPTPLRSQEAALERALRPGATAPTRFLARKGSQFVVVEESRILYFGSEGSLTRLVADSSDYWMAPTLNELERRLAPSRFFRISRAALVNLSAVTEVRPESGNGEVTLRNGVKLEVSRRRTRHLLEYLAGMV
ncbi:LytR/AlgR family response regulator transcription factor [Paludibaculum fermentans]|uniref:Response regulator transcription factor n=1 Tax=Paludibaculum fermentans TaxID=1473598 RepID=A0A7S7NRJ8_PALFE|nr:LytTR family DNA-binding domain-containing protein [Paludibaculum fermentans]QOY88376.1 response regulator transcription factor [Paludibaculum fermentans]